MALAKSCFSGSRIVNLIPCTSSEGRLCHIFREISLWNEYLSQDYLELRELSPGRLSLVQQQNAPVRGAYANIQDILEQMNTVATLVHHLLTSHHCVNSAAIFTSVSRDRHQLICDALCKSLNLTKLKLYSLRNATHSPRNVATALLHLNHLRELELQGMPLSRNFIDRLSDFLESTRSLTALTLRSQHFECEEDAVAFVQGLRRNQTITTLSFDMIILGADPLDNRLVTPVSPGYGAVFAGYLRCNKTLRALGMQGCRLERSTEVARPIFEALIKNNTLTKLILASLSLGQEDIEIVTSLVSQNRTLTSFSMIGCHLNVVHSQVYRYLAAFTTNKTLEVLTLDIPRFNTNECRPLFKALASNPSLKKLTIERVYGADVVDLCRAVRETGARERFFVGTHYVVKDTIDALTECTELSSVEVQSDFFDGLEPLLTTLRLLPSCSHLTSVGLVLRPDDYKGSASSLIAQCITGMTALRKLKLAIARAWTGVAFKEAGRELAQALSVNKSIRKLIVCGPLFGETEIEMLADTLQSSRSLCEVFFFPQRPSCVSSLIQKLSSNIYSNYTLLDIRLDKPWNLGGVWFTVADVLRRNCWLVTRAAHFVMGTRLKYCAAAAELVHSNPGLVEKVQELTPVDEDEAVSWIKKSITSISELDDFMRLVGVVKYGVTCHSRDDGQKQLVDISRDCWLCLRQYIKVGDILDEQ